MQHLRSTLGKWISISVISIGKRKKIFIRFLRLCKPEMNK